MSKYKTIIKKEYLEKMELLFKAVKKDFKDERKHNEHTNK